MSWLSAQVLELRRAVDRFLNGEARGPGEVLSAVFALNNRVGPVLRREGSPLLRDLQFKINEVTLAAKSEDKKRLAMAIGAVEASAAILGPEEG